MSDRVLVPCPGCATDLRIPAASVGTTILCPVCRRPVAVPRDAPPADPPAPEPPPAPPPAEPPPAPVASEPPAADAPVAPEAPPTPPPAEPVPAVAPGRKRFPLSTGIALTVAAAVGLGVFLAMRPAVRGEIPESAWKAVEVPGRFRALLPGKAQPEKSQLPGTNLTLILYSAAPDKESVYAAGFSEQVIPVAELGGKVDQVVDQLADVLVDDVKQAGGREARRAKLGDKARPGREVVLKLPGKQGTMAYRVYLVRGRVYVLMAGGPDLDADHPNVTRLFRSFEPLDGAAPPMPDEP